MTGQGVALICLGALAMSALVFHQLLNKRLYVGYAVAWLIVLFGGICVVAVPPLARAAARVAGSLFAASGLALLSFGFILLVLIYFSIQLSILSDRITKIAQALAISNLERGHVSPVHSGDTEGQ